MRAVDASTNVSYVVSPDDATIPQAAYRTDAEESSAAQDVSIATYVFV